MENITTGHWIFAGIFMVAFVGYLIWSYKKDSKTHKLHYGIGAKVLLVMIVAVFLLFIFKRLF
jgi:membrane protein YdbS with pleckstrin-like domain